jgi:hypothetical protein
MTRLTDEGNNYEVPIIGYAFKDVELPIQPSRIHRVEYLSKNKRIEDQRLHNGVIPRRIRKAQDLDAKEVE